MTKITLVRYLRKEKKIIVPNDWSSTLRGPSDTAVEVYGLPSEELVDNIIRGAEYWKPYITEESFSPLVLGMVSSMATYHACAVGSYATLPSSFIGSIPGVTLKCYPTLPKQAMMSITRKGKIWLSVGQGSPIREF